MGESAISSQEVRRSYEVCRRMQRRHDPTFYVATRRLPADARPAVHALYGFVRGADEIVDGDAGPEDPAGKRAALDAWQAELQHGLAAGRTAHPVLAALVDTGARRDLPLDQLAVYMDSMRVDCGPVRIGDEAELDRYMNGSAATVGRIMAPILGAPAEAERFAALGVAFQLTNFIRDVREDLAMDRQYLPGWHEDSRAAVARQVGRARELFATTAGLHDEMPGAVRGGMRLARAVYERVLDRVEQLEFDVLRPRAALPAWQVVAAAGGSLIPVRAR
ncbi:MAG: phytoene/squalene synthase family protein [Solirubrobacterales bacterium]|jgi:phytoene synthase|nr:phytoene/squalene synthase family protein [Solirubrobacterales bacterium]